MPVPLVFDVDGGGEDDRYVDRKGSGGPPAPPHPPLPAMPSLATPSLTPPSPPVAAAPSTRHVLTLLVRSGADSFTFASTDVLCAERNPWNLLYMALAWLRVSRPPASLLPVAFLWRRTHACARASLLHPPRPKGVHKHETTADLLAACRVQIVCQGADAPAFETRIPMLRALVPSQARGADQADAFFVVKAITQIASHGSATLIVQHGERIGGEGSGSGSGGGEQTSY